MKNKKKFFLFSLIVLFQLNILLAFDIDSTSSTKSNNDISVLTVIKKPKKYSAKKAALLSGILPGLGQAYNKKYWKIPIVYSLIGYFGYNVYNYYSWFLKAEKALPAFNKLAFKDSTDFKNIDPIFQKMTVTNVQRAKDYYREQFDQQILWFILFWGLNIIDAAVDAHLKQFDVNENLSIKLMPHIQSNSFSNNLPNINYGLSLQVLFDNKSKKKEVSFNY